jgi:[ribosomal protein S5]-alanine N-acetyltransferase
LAIQVDGSLALTTVLETERLALRQFSPGDAPFVLGLFNDSAFLRFIGDKCVRTEEDAVAYIEREYIASYRRNGYGPYCVMLKSEPIAIGMCGLLRRDWLPDTDLGYAFLPAYWRQGYAAEAARGVVDYAVKTLGMRRVVAITDPENLDSMKVLTRVGFVAVGIIRKGESGPALNLFSFGTA